MSWLSLRRYFVGVSATCVGLVLPLVSFAQTTGSNTQVRLSVPIGSMTSVAAEGGLAQYIVGVYGYMLGIVTIVAIIMVMYGGFRYLLGSTYGDVKTGQGIIKDALGGMAVLFLAYFILYNVNPKTVTLQVPGLTRIRSVSLELRQAGQADFSNASSGTACVVDADCSGEAKCLRTSSVTGLCTSGRPGNLCRCQGTGCDVTVQSAGGPTNNAFSRAYACQSGFECLRINSDDRYECSGGGAGSACNESTEYTFSGMNAVRGSASAARSTASTAVTNPLTLPLVALVPVASVVGGVAGGTSQSMILRCRESSQTCFQPAEDLSGACVYGDHRDASMFDGIPAYSQNQGLRSAVERCDLTVEQLRQTPKSSGGCRNITNNNVDEFCVAHRYRCANQAVCTRSEYAGAFASTLAQYHSWENVPQQLRPEYFLHQGCKKPANAACTADAECSTKCVQGRCVGVGLVVIKDGITPGTIRGLPTAAQVEGIAAPPQSCDSSWTWVQLLSQEGLPVTERQAVLDRLFSAGTADRFACYPKRAPNEACDFNEQCRSGGCTIPAGVTRPGIPASYATPMNVQAGVGRCT